jgi:anti-sigma B factor antagonist
MNLSFETRGEVLLTHVLDTRFEAGAADDFKKLMSEQVSQGRTRIVLDLSGVKFMDSGALGAILGVVKSLTPPGDLRLSGVKEPVRTVFRLTRLDKVLSLLPDEETAIASFGG